MPRILKTATFKLTRFRCDPHDPTKCFFTFPGGRRNGRSQVTFVKSEDVPPFEGDEAWFEMEYVQATPWSYWRAVRQVDGPGPRRTPLAPWERLAAISAAAEQQRKLDADKAGEQ